MASSSVNPNVLFLSNANATVSGSVGLDVFVVSPASGSVTISGFATGSASDIVDLAGFSFSNFAAVQAAMKQVGTDTVISVGTGQTVTLKNVAAASLTANNVLIQSVAPDSANASAIAALAGFVGTYKAPTQSVSGASTAWLSASAQGTTLTGGSGNTQFNDNGFAVTMVGGAGDNNYVIGNASDTIIQKAGAGVSTVTTWLPAYKLAANITNLTMIGGSDAQLYGNATANTIVANDANDVIDGGGGNDLIAGGRGADTFVVNLGYGVDTITGFNKADIVRIQNFGLTTFADLRSRMAQVGNNVYIALTATDGVVLANVSLASLTAANFQFDTQAAMTSSQSKALRGSDTFILTKGNGSTSIQDFASGDKLDLVNYGFSSTSQILAAAKQNGVDTVISLGTGETVTLKNTAVTSLTASMFQIDAATVAVSASTPSVSPSPSAIAPATPAAVAPVTVAAAYGAAAGQALTVAAANGVLSKDQDKNGLTLTAAIAPNGGPTHGAVTLNADGSFVYRPNVGFAGTDSFTYIASDSLSKSASTVVTITVTGSAPAAKADAYAASAGQVLSVTAASGVLANDADANGLALCAALAQNGGPSHGTLALNVDGSFLYTPTAGFSGTDSFTYIASDSLSKSTPTTVTVTVAAPVSAGGVATSYLDYKNNPMLASSAKSKQYWGNGGSILTGVAGGDTFNVYSAADKVIEAAGGGVSTVVAALRWYGDYQLSANVNDLSISGTNVTGIGNNLDNLMIAQGSGKITLDGAGGNDVLVGNSGATTFVMAKGYGHDVIYNFNTALDQVRLDNFGISDFNTVKSDMAQVGQDVVITLDPNDSVILRNTTINQLSANNFQLSIDTTKLRTTFDDEFNTFTSSPDGSKGWMTTYPYAGSSARTLSSNGEKEYYSDSSVGVNPFSDNNGVLTITAAPATPGQGTPAGAGLTYTSGLITTYKSFSQLYGYFDVSAKLPAAAGFLPAFWLLPANNTWPPELDVMEQLGGDPDTIYETTHSAVSGPNVQTQFVTSVPTSASGFNDYGVDWEADKITWYINGIAVASMATPADMHSAMYMLIDLAVGANWGGSADGTTSATLQINSVKVYAPTEIHAAITTVDSYSASAGKTLTVSAANGVLGNDIDQNAQTLSAILAQNGGPAHGTLTLNTDGSFVYQANAGFAGTDSFSYLATDSSSQSAATKVTLSVAAHAPTARADSYSVSAGQALTVAAASGVLANDADQNGLSLSSVLAQNGGPAHGTIALGANGAFTYTPQAGFAGVDSFSYFASDSLSQSALTTVNLTVAAHAPSTKADAYSVSAGQTLAISAGNGVLTNDTDKNGLALSASIAPNGGPSHGVLTLNSDGSLSYVANTGFAGTDSFTYIANDSLTSSTPTTVVFNVAAHNPVTVADTYAATSGQAFSVGVSNGVLSNDSDPNGLVLSAALAQNSGPSHGTLTLNNNGSFTYKSNAGYSGTDSFSYVASDSLAHSAATKVTLNLTAAH